MNNYKYVGETDQFRLPPATSYFLRDAALWAKILSILGFILIGLHFVLIMTAGFFISVEDIMQFSNPGLFVVLNFIFLGVFFFLVYFLYDSSSKMQRALITEDAYTLSEAFNSLKNYFLINTIFLVVGLIVLIIALIAGILFLMI